MWCIFRKRMPPSRLPTRIDLSFRGGWTDEQFQSYDGLDAVALLAVIAALVLQVFEMRDYGLFARLMGK